MTSIGKIAAEAAKDSDDFRHVISYREMYRRTESFNLLQTGEHLQDRSNIRSMDADIDIVVPVHNALDDVKLCLKHLLAESLPHHSRVVILDDGSNRETSDFLKSLQGHSVVYRKNPSRVGFTKSVDSAIRSSLAKYVAILNSDTIPTRGWLHSLAACLSADPKIAMVGPLSNSAAWQSIGRILAPNGRFVPRWPGEIDAGDVSYFLGRNHTNLFIPMDVLHGFCFLLRRDAYCKVGGFDLTSFPVGYGETQDLSLQFRTRGYRIGVCPSSFVTHRGTRSFTPIEKSMYGTRARTNLYEKYGPNTYLEAETKCLLNPDLTIIRTQLYGWFTIPHSYRHNFLPASLNSATLLRIEETWSARRSGIVSHVGCNETRVGKEYRFITISDKVNYMRRSPNRRNEQSQTHPPFAPSRACDRLKAFPAFNAHMYRSTHPDIEGSGLDAATHFLAYGSREQRVAFDKKVVSREMGKLHNCDKPRIKFPKTRHLHAIKEVGVYCSSAGNLFMRIIAQRLCHELNDRGVYSTLLDETASVHRRPDVCVFVAPHEFFYIGEGKKWDQEDIVSSAVMLNTEQVQEKWFHMAARYLFNAAGVIDICHQNAQLLAKSGVPSLFWMPPLLRLSENAMDTNISHPLSEVLPRNYKARPNAAALDRPLDLTFFGATTRRRERFFARTARWLAQYDNMIYLRRAQGPLDGANSGQELLAVTKAATASAKISLNIHRDDVGYFEWHRIVDIGMATGAVVVSERCVPHPIFKESIHYISENLRFFPDLIDWLLKEKDGNRKLRDVRCAVDEIADKGSTRALSDELVDFIGHMRPEQHLQKI